MKEWKTYKVGDICSSISETYKSKSKSVVLINTSDVLEGRCLNHEFVPNKDLKGQFKKVFKFGDILYSEIRPANKRFAYIDFDATDYIASTKLMVLRNNDKVTNRFLYHYLKSESTIAELQALAESRSGTFPQITFSELSQLEISIPDIETQLAISSFIDTLESKIELNRQINDNLEQQAQAAFNNIVANYSECETINLSEIAALNPKRTIAKGTLARSIEMAQLPTSGSFPAGWDMKEYNGGMKFQNGDTLMARITPCLENGKVAYINFLEENEVAFGSTEYIVIASKGAIAPEVFYFLTRHNDFIDFAVKNMNGSSGRQRVSAETIGTYKLPVISPEDIVVLETIAKAALNKIKYNSLENIRLSEMRDTLLPKLMSGEVKINEIDC